MRHRDIDRSLIAVILLGVFVCVGFTIVNTLLYVDHPRGRDLNLIGAIWCAVMAALTFYNAARIAAINRSMTGSWWSRRWKTRL